MSVQNVFRRVKDNIVRHRITYSQLFVCFANAPLIHTNIKAGNIKTALYLFGVTLYCELLALASAKRENAQHYAKATRPAIATTNACDAALNP